jgi:hypothetical protein
MYWPVHSSKVLYIEGKSSNDITLCKREKLLLLRQPFTRAVNPRANELYLDMAPSNSPLVAVEARPLKIEFLDNKNEKLGTILAATEILSQDVPQSLNCEAPSPALSEKQSPRSQSVHQYGKQAAFDRSQRPLHVLVAGAGPSGIAMAIQLMKLPNVTFQLVEKNHDVGGTWLENRYPGAACDVASHAYQYTFESNKAWSRQ